MKKVAFVLLFSFVALQLFPYGNRWKRTRYEIGGGIGMAGFMGDLGGALGTGPGLKRFVADYDFQSTRPSLTGFMRYRLSRSLTAKVSFSFGMLSGNDKFSGEPARETRNLNFRSILMEQALMFEYFVINEKNSRRWSRRRRRKTLSFNPSMYLFTGIGGFFFNPQGKYNGQWYNLRPIGTEGQNITGNTYALYQACVPLGMGLTFGLNRKTSIGVELGYRFTFTDYVDDVGSTYYDNAAIIESNSGETYAGWLADAHQVAQTSPKVFVEGDFEKAEYKQYKGVYSVGDRIPFANGTGYRGGDKKDMYMFLMFTMQYKLRTTRRGLPKF